MIRLTAICLTLLLPLGALNGCSRKSSKAGDTGKPTVPRAIGEGVELLSLTSPADRGSPATVQIRTHPGAECVICVLEHFGSNQSNMDEGLKPKTADDHGLATWKWTVAPDADVGSHSLIFIVTYERVRQDIRIPFEVR